MLPAPVLYKNFDVQPFIDELRERIGEELDYRIEAANQRLFADWYRGHPFIHVPDVLDDAQQRPGAHDRAGHRRALRRARDVGRRTSATSRARPSSGSCSAASTG